MIERIQADEVAADVAAIGEATDRQQEAVESVKTPLQEDTV